MYGFEPIQEYIAEIVRKAYGDAVRSPDAFVVAEALGIERRSSHEVESASSSDPSVARAFSMRGDGPDASWVIYHDQQVRRERQQFDVAHEIIEQYVIDNPHLLEALCHDAGELDDDGFRDLAHQAACFCTKDLLINAAEFEADYQQSGGDLLELKGRYPNASHEVIAYAVLPLLAEERTGVVITIMDQPRGGTRRIYRRMLASQHNARIPLTDLETSAAGDCFESGQPVERSGEIEIAAMQFKGYGNVRAWPVFEEDWKRVIMFIDAESL